MIELFFEDAIPFMIALVFAGFFWAWVLSAVKAPGRAEDHRISGRVNPDWRYLDAGPEGIRKGLFEKVKPQTKSVG